MSNTENSMLSGYNSLLDKNLSGYFSNTKMRKHLVRSGMIDKDGRITSENAYRMKMARKEHRDNVRELLASAIVDKALDMERMRRYEIRKRLEELYKIELVQKVRSERGKRVNDDLVALLTPRKKSGKRKAKSAAVTKVEKNDTKLPNIHSGEKTRKIYENPESYGSVVGSLVDRSPAPPPSDRKKLHPHPPPGRNKKKKKNIHRGLLLAKSDQMIAHRIQLQSMAEVTMKYLGSPLNLTNDLFPTNKVSEIQIIQQHCGASTICVFKELLPANTIFTFISRRHRGSPFGLTIYINGIQNIRLSSCCEYKHKPGHKVGGKNSQFGLVAVQGAAPCYKCQVRLNLVGGSKTKEQENEGSSSDEEAAVKSYDIIVSRLGRHSDSKLERPESASVMTQTAEGGKVVDEYAEEGNDYQDEEFEDDAQFSQKQEELSSDEEILSSSESSGSESEDDDNEDEKELEVEDSAEKSSEPEVAEYSSDKQEDDDTAKDEDKDLSSGSGSESDSESSSSDESEKSIEVEIPSEPKKPTDDEVATEVAESTTEEASEAEVATEVEESATEEASEAVESTEDEKPTETVDEKQNDVIDDEISNHITIEKDVSSDDESTVSASSSSSSSSSSDSDSDSDKEDSKDVKVEEVKNSSESAESAKSDDENEDGKEDHVVLSDEAPKAVTSDQDNDSSTVEEASDSEHHDSDNVEKDHVEDEVIEEHSEKKDDQEVDNATSDKIDDDHVMDVTSDKIDENLEMDNVTSDDLVLPDVKEEKESDSDVSDDSDNRATSVISRESTMLTGNEDGNFDSANITIQFNEEVDVVTYAKGETASDETPRSDESEHEFEIDNVTGGNVMLADLGDDDDDDVDDDDSGDDDDDDDDKEINNLVNKAEDMEVKSGDADDEEDDVDDVIGSAESILHSVPVSTIESERRAFKAGSVDSFVNDWSNVALENLYLTEDQTYELISSIKENKDFVTNFSLKNTVVDGGIEVIKDALRQAINLETLDLSSSDLGPDEVEHLVEVILDGTKDIQSLRLRGNPIDDEGTLILTTALSKLKDFRSLDLSNCKVSDDASEALFDYLSENKTLTELILSNNEINNEGWRYIASALQENNTLEVLIVDSNNMGNEGIRLLCNGMIKNKCLHTLDVRNNGIDDEGFDALYAALVKCQSLLSVEFMPNLFSEQNQDNLYKLLEMKN